MDNKLMKPTTQNQASNKWCPDRKYMEKYTDQFCTHVRCGAWIDLSSGSITNNQTGEYVPLRTEGYCGKYQGER